LYLLQTAAHASRVTPPPPHLAAVSALCVWLRANPILLRVADERCDFFRTGLAQLVNALSLEARKQAERVAAAERQAAAAAAKAAKTAAAAAVDSCAASGGDSAASGDAKSSAATAVRPGSASASAAAVPYTLALSSQQLCLLRGFRPLETATAEWAQAAELGFPLEWQSYAVSEPFYVPSCCPSHACVRCALRLCPRTIRFDPRTILRLPPVILMSGLPCCVARRFAARERLCSSTSAASAIPRSRLRSSPSRPRSSMK
jgi:hypothetical protein